MNKDLERCYDPKRQELYVKIIKRAEDMDLAMTDRESSTMDIICADYTFNLRLNEWLEADDFNFVHDWYGIANNLDRDKFPSKKFGLFVPRFAGRD